MQGASFWKGRRVFVTGHTGFKGSWLCLWLKSLGAEVTGYALEPPTEPSLFELCGLRAEVPTVVADVRDGERLRTELGQARPEIVFHLAAQPLVRAAYRAPAETYAVNVMGTVNLLEAARACGGVRALVNVTSDKCYENREWLWGYRENEPLGGRDPYASSKACSELVTQAYAASFFAPGEHAAHGTAVATARAGNIIGGGDWAGERLVPDCIRAVLRGEAVRIRSPLATRPWQHVLEPLAGYLLLAERLFDNGQAFGGPWNFGPADGDARTVEQVVRCLCAAWGEGAASILDPGPHPHEAHYLKLDCSKARAVLGWRPRWDLETAIDRVVAWTRVYQAGGDVRAACLAQIADYGAAVPR